MMPLDPWQLTVLGLTVIAVLRPCGATMAQRLGPIAKRRRYDLHRASGGAAMVAMCLYLVHGAEPMTGTGYWALPLSALHDRIMLVRPVVWLPTLCWLTLAVLGVWFMFAGIRGCRGPRDPFIALWALNETAICIALLWWAVYVPADWPEVRLINFGLKGIYIAWLIGAVLRLVLVLLGPGSGTSHLPRYRTGAAKASSMIARLRRF